MLRLLLSLETVDVDAKAPYVSDNTPLMEAVTRRQLLAAETLVYHGADLALKNKVIVSLSLSPLSLHRWE